MSVEKLIMQRLSGTFTRMPNTMLATRNTCLIVNTKYASTLANFLPNGNSSNQRNERNSSASRLISFMPAVLLGGTFYLFYRLKSSSDSNRSLLLRSEQSGSEDESKAENNSETDKSGGKARHGFRDQRVVEYENRIKQYSTPDKIFRYYATLKIGQEPFMTPSDFVRSIIPDTKQPEGLGLDKFKNFDPEVDNPSEEIPEDSIFNKLGVHGLISFSDYVFLLTVLSTPAKNFEVAFKVFDINGDGIVEYSEFDHVAGVIRASGSVGQRHRNHKTTGNVIEKPVSSGLGKYFFGENLDKKLSVDHFLEFQKSVHRGVLQLECAKFSENRDSMSEIQFSKLLLMYLPQSGGKKTRMLNKIRKVYSKPKKSDEDEEEQEPINSTETKLKRNRIPMEDVYTFFDLMNRLNEVEQAISFWTLSGASIDKETFKHVAEIVGKKKLNEHLIEVIFNLFDDDGDGMLSYYEFFAIMKTRAGRNLGKPRELGIDRLVKACLTCAKTTDFVSAFKKKVFWSS